MNEPAQSVFSARNGVRWALFAASAPAVWLCATLCAGIWLETQSQPLPGFDPGIARDYPALPFVVKGALAVTGVACALSPPILLAVLAWSMVRKGLSPAERLGVGAHSITGMGVCWFFFLKYPLGPGLWAALLR